jgi:hypothetical protein
MHMRAIAKVKNLRPEEGSNTIARNLSRIMDMRIVDLDARNQLLTFVYTNPAVLHKVLRELSSIGYPVQRLDELEHRYSKETFYPPVM